MKRKILLIAMAVMTVIACSFAFVACTDGDVSSVNGTYLVYTVELDESGHIISGERMEDISYGYEGETWKPILVLKDGKYYFWNLSGEYTLKGEDIYVDNNKLKKLADGVYMPLSPSSISGEEFYIAYVRKDVTPPFEIRNDPVNGTYTEYEVELDENGNIHYGVVVKSHGEALSVVLKNGKITEAGGNSWKYSMNDEDIIVHSAVDVTYKKISDGVYLGSPYQNKNVCIVRDDITPPFEVQEDIEFPDFE